MAKKKPADAQPSWPTWPEAEVIAAPSINLRVGEAHVVHGGPPCQGFSIANSNRSKGDIRNTLVPEFLRVVREAQPHYFIMENVPGFCTLADGECLRDFLRLAHGCYYELVYGLVDAVQHGVPQYRCRFICMGTRRDLAEIDGSLASLPAPTNFSDRDLLLIEGGEVRLSRPAGIRYFPDRVVLIPPHPVSHAGDGRVSQGHLRFYDRLLADEPDRVPWMVAT